MDIVVFGNASGLGGAQTAFRRFTEFLELEGHRVAVIALRDRCSANGIGGFEPRGVDTSFDLQLATKSVVDRLEKLVQTARIGLHFRKFVPDGFVSVGLSKSANIIAQILPRKTNKIALDFIADREISDPLFLESLAKFGRIGLQSPSIEKMWLRRRIPASQLTTLPCFPSEIYPGARKDGLSFCPSTVRLGYFGRLAANKGVVELIQAFSLLKVHGNIQLDIWGTGPEHDNVSRAITRFREDMRISQRGVYPSGQEGSTLLAGYDGIVVPSQQLEGLPLVLLEAMGHGVPALCTDVGAIRDCCVANPDFILVKPTVQALAEGLNTFVHRLRGSEFNHDRLISLYEKNYSFDAISGRWRQFLAGWNRSVTPR